MIGGAALGLFLACAVAGILVPVPEDVALLLAGWEVGRGELSPIVAVVAGGLGVLTRDLTAFLVGRWIGPRIEHHPRVHRFIGERRLAWAHGVFARHGDRVVLVTRFAVGVRAPLYFVAGSLGMSLRRFLLADLAGLSVTVPLNLWIGARAGPDAVSWLLEWVHHQRLVVGLGLLVLLGWLLWRRRVERA